MQETHRVLRVIDRKMTMRVKTAMICNETKVTILEMTESTRDRPVLPHWNYRLTNL